MCLLFLLPRRLSLQTPVWLAASFFKVCSLCTPSERPSQITATPVSSTIFLTLFFSISLTPWHSEKTMAPHSNTLAWKIPWMEEPGRLQSMGSRRVGHDWATSLSLFTFMYWRRKWQPTPVFLPRESQGWGSLVGCRLWGHRVGHDWATSLSLFTLCIGEGNGNPLQYSCLENPRDGGAWWAAFYVVAQSRTRPKWLSSSGAQLHSSHTLAK